MRLKRRLAITTQWPLATRKRQLSVSFDYLPTFVSHVLISFGLKRGMWTDHAQHRPTPAGTNISTMNPCSLNVCCNISGQCGMTDDICVISKSASGAPDTAAPG